ncbi:hypothetical protein BGX26_001794 [Mortierella sp. AD094]|nr:hypothetical protein BGX26_001794 [Mortierella sp. AD094]
MSVPILHKGKLVFAEGFGKRNEHDPFTAEYFETGSKIQTSVLYNNIMYTVAGEAAANVAGVPYEDLVREKVLKPLGLNNTEFSTAEMSKHPNYAMSHTAESFKDAQNGKFKVVALDDFATKDALAGDLYSNVLDIVRWGQTIMHYGELDGKQILNKESVTEMLSGQSIFSKKRRTSEFPPVRVCGGNVPGFLSNSALFPDSDLVVAHLSNTNTALFTLYSFL